MHGYLWEFVSDDWHDSYQEAPTDGGSWHSQKRGPNRVIRGGAWTNHFDMLSSSARQPFGLTDKNPATGFRCVKARVTE